MVVKEKNIFTYFQCCKKFSYVYTSIKTFRIIFNCVFEELNVIERYTKTHSICIDKTIIITLTPKK